MIEPQSRHFTIKPSTRLPYAGPKEYAELLESDPAHAAKEEHVSSLARGLSEVVAAEDCSGLAPVRTPA